MAFLVKCQLASPFIINCTPCHQLPLCIICQLHSDKAKHDYIILKRFFVFLPPSLLLDLFLPGSAVQECDSGTGGTIGLPQPASKHSLSVVYTLTLVYTTPDYGITYSYSTLNIRNSTA